MQNDAQLDLTNLWDLAARKFVLGLDSLHGPDHWRRVEHNALTVAHATEDADILVVRLFAVLHDSCRLNESHDPEHGRRAANWTIDQLHTVHFDLAPARLNLLTEAMIWHDKGKISGDPTIGACWDADRLDLPRVGIRPEAKYMSTAHGKKLAGAP
jgi:uncharacterized protein